MRSIITGTAGHIDHGKTALVRALTGIDTDRLEEEKRRGISIDLGFAHLALGDDLRVGFVDVPGHERFVKNMLAGASGIDLALLVVSAAESIKPQTREHFDICRLLGLQGGLVAITKADLADEEMIELVKLEIEELVADSFLAGKPMVPVSAVTKRGFDELKLALRQQALAVQAKSTKAWFRMPVDRAFSMKGFGSVVTGTILAGEVKADDEVTLHPENRPVRVRGVQVHGAAAGRATAGQRTALNLAGVELAELRRGQVLSTKGIFQPVKHLDARLTLLASARALKNRAPVHFHIGTAEVEARVVLLDGNSTLEPGQAGWVRFTLREAVLALPGDRFIVRMFSPVITIGGGAVADIAPPRRSPAFASRVERLQAFQQDPVGALLREAKHGLGVAEAVTRTGLRRDEIVTPRRLFLREHDWLLDGEWLERTRQSITRELTAFHKANPLLPGMPREDLRGRVLPAAPSFVFDHALTFPAEGDLVRLPTHKVVMQVDESAALAKMEKLFADAGLAVPAVAEVLAASGVDQKRAQTLLATLQRDRKLVRISAELVYHATAVAQLKALLAPRKGARFAVPEFKEWTGVSRKYAIPLLEFLDRERMTRREGDQRVIL
jgi:selenocysteine-specific elongation factor